MEGEALEKLPVMLLAEVELDNGDGVPAARVGDVGLVLLVDVGGDLLLVDEPLEGRGRVAAAGLAADALSLARGDGEATLEVEIKLRVLCVIIN